MHDQISLAAMSPGFLTTSIDEKQQLRKVSDEQISDEPIVSVMQYALGSN